MGTNGDFPYIEAQKSNRETVQADFSHYAEDFLGEHDLKFGVQYTKAEGNYLGGYFQGYANFAYPYPWWPYGPATGRGGGTAPRAGSGAPTRTRCTRSTTGRSRPTRTSTVRESDSTGVFVDDRWVVNDRVTVNLGLRYDNMTAGYGTGEIYEQFDIALRRRAPQRCSASGAGPVPSTTSRPGRRASASPGR